MKRAFVVSNDFLPNESELRRLLSQAGLEMVRPEDTSDYYLVIACKKLDYFKLEANV